MYVAENVPWLFSASGILHINGYTFASVIDWLVDKVWREVGRGPDTVYPVAPVTPVLPIIPVDPVGPAPVDPVVPLEPVLPVIPGPVEPVGPMGPPESPF